MPRPDLPAYREEGLTLRTKRPRRRKMCVQRQARCKPTAPNDAWSLDFVADQLADGRRFRLLTVIDVFTRGPDGLIEFEFMPTPLTS